MTKRFKDKVDKVNWRKLRKAGAIATLAIILFSVIILPAVLGYTTEEEAATQVSDIPAYGVIEPSGCGYFKGKVKIRFDLYMTPEADYYNLYHVEVVDPSSSRYLGKVDEKTGEPLDWGKYQEWWDGLPKVRVNNPFHSHFVYFDTDVTDEEIKAKLVEVTEYFYAFHEDCWGSEKAFIEEWKRVPKQVGTVRDVFIAGIEDKVDCEPKVNEIVAHKDGFDTREFEKVEPSPQDLNIGEKGTIDVGSPAINRDNKAILYYSANVYTQVDGNNPANADGTIDTVEAWFSTAFSGNSVKYGTFEDLGSNELKCHDGEEYGKVAAGSKQTCTGLSIAISTGEYIGADARAAEWLRIEMATSGGAGRWWIRGQYCDPNDQGTFTLSATSIISLYGTGTEPPPEVDTKDCENIGATSFDAKGEILVSGGATKRGFHYSKVFDDFEWGEFDAEEDFEWGVDTDPLDDSGGTVTWTIDVAGTSRAEIDTTYHYSGTRSARLYYDGINIPKAQFSQSPISSSQFIALMFRKDNAAKFEVNHGNGFYCIRAFINTDGAIYYYDGSSHSTGVSVAEDTWYRMIIRNVDWDAHTYDIYLGSFRVESGAMMQNVNYYDSLVVFRVMTAAYSYNLDEVVVGYVPLSDSGGAITWSITVAGTSKAEIDTAQHYSGTRSARLYRDGTNNPNAEFVQAAMGSTQVWGTWIRKEYDAQLLMYHGDGTKCINVECQDDEDLGYYDGSIHQDTGVDIPVDEWFLIEVRNADWDGGTYDIYLNGILAKSGAAMRTSSIATNDMRYYATKGDSSVWLDEVAVWDVEDEDGSFGEGEYSLEITGLDPETTYYVQAFAKNIAGFGYGDVVSAMTIAAAVGYSQGYIIG